MSFNDHNLTPEQLEAFKSCTTPESVLALAQSEGIELSDDELDTISGGGWDDPIGIYCPKCNSMLLGVKRGEKYTCYFCGYTS